MTMISINNDDEDGGGEAGVGDKLLLFSLRTAAKSQTFSLRTGNFAEAVPARHSCMAVIMFVRRQVLGDEGVNTSGDVLLHCMLCVTRLLF